MASNRDAAAQRFHSTNGLSKFLGQRSLLEGLRRGLAPEGTSDSASPQAGTNDGPERAAEVNPNPFASPSGGLLALAGPRSAFHVEKRPSGEFVLRHIDSGRTTTVCGIDYIRFADLTVHREFLVRSNPEVPAEPAAEQVDPEPVDPPEDTVVILEPEEPAAEAIEPDAADETEEEVVASPPQPPSTDLSAPSSGGDDEGFAVNDDGSLTITAAHFVAASDEDRPLRVVALSSPSRGRITDNGDESWTFSPDEAFEGEVSFDVILADEKGEKTLARATIEVEASDPAIAAEMPEPAQETPSAPARAASVSLLRITADFVKPLVAALAGPAGNAFDIDLGVEARDLPLARKSISASGEFVTPLRAEARISPAPDAAEMEREADDESIVPEPEPEPRSQPEPTPGEPSRSAHDDEDRRLRELVDRLLERADDILASDVRRPASKPATDVRAVRATEPSPVRVEPSQRDAVKSTDSPAKTVRRQGVSFETFENFDW